MPDRLAEGVLELSRFCEVEVFEIGQVHSQSRFIADHVRSVLTGRPFTDFLYRSRDYAYRLTDVISRGEVPLVHVDSLDLAGYLGGLDGRRVVCVHHNVESLLLRRRAASEASWLRRKYIEHQSTLIRRSERHWCPRVALNIAVSEHDAHELTAIAPGSRIEVVPNGVDVDRFQPQTDGDDGMVFVGGSTWFPNRDALKYFCDSILPHVRNDLPGARVHWVGAAREEDIRHYKSLYDVELTGYVDDIRPLVHRAACFVVPLRVGGGSRLKILDAWAMGKAVVSTSVGCEGLATVDGENILIRDRPEEFANAIMEVIRNPVLRHRLGTNGRKTVETRYGWESIGAGMIRHYEQLLRNFDGHVN